jgi:hypothetical protein
MSVAVAVLLKGPIGFVLPAAVIAVFLLLENRVGIGRSSGFQPDRTDWQSILARSRWLKMIHALGLWWGIPLVLAITLPWFIWANQATGGELFNVFFWKHNVERGLGSGTLRTYPWWHYGPELAFDLLPWSVILPISIWLFFRKGWWREDSEGCFGLMWFLVNVVFLSCLSFKRADYLLPAYPGIALFMGSVLERCWGQAVLRRSLTVFLAATAGICLFGWLLYLEFLLPQQEQEKASRPFAAEIRRRAPAPQLILFFRTEAHALAFHVGRPIDTILEWENLDIWASRPETYHVVLLENDAAEWSRHMTSGRLVEVARCPASPDKGADRHPWIPSWLATLGTRQSDAHGSIHGQGLVLMRTCPGGSSNAP